MLDHVPVADLTIADEDGINKFLAGTCDDALAPPYSCADPCTDTTLTCDATPAD